MIINKEKSISTYLAAVVATICIMLMWNVCAYGATANISVSSQNVSNGEEVKVNIDVTSDQNIGAFDLRITYNSKVLEYVSGADNGGSGVLQVLNSDLTQSNTVTKELVFKAISEGSSEIAVQAASSSVMDMSAVLMEIAGGTGTVTVGSGASGDNNLTSLSVAAVDDDGNNSNVSITPDFSADVLEYKAEVGENVKKLAVAVTTSDPSAKTKISGVKLDAGENLTTIRVTSADGQNKEYKIYTIKGGSTTENTATNDNGLLPVPEDKTPHFSQKIGRYVIQNFDAVGIPEGFNQCGISYEDKQLTALSGYNGNVILMCLADDENGTNSALFVYNSGTDTFSLYNKYVVEENDFILLTPDSGVSVPEGYSETTVQINGIDTVAWQGGIYKSGSGFYLVYAISQSGNKGFYVYDTEENSFLRFVTSTKGESTDQGLQADYEELKKKSDDDDFVKLEIVIGFTVLCLALIIYVSVLLSKIKKLRQMTEETYEEENNTDEPENANEPPKELKLDMAIQANEIKPETLANDVNEILENSQTAESADQEQKNEPENIDSDTKETDKADESDNEKDDSDMDIVFVDIESEDK